MITANQKELSRETALLNYSDAYYIEQYAQDECHRSICISNIGVLMLQQGEYRAAYSYFSQAIDSQTKRIYDACNTDTIQTRGNIDTNFDMQAMNSSIQTEQFILACRYYNRGIAKLAIEQEARQEDETKEMGRNEYKLADLAPKKSETSQLADILIGERRQTVVNRRIQGKRMKRMTSLIPDEELEKDDFEEAIDKLEISGKNNLATLEMQILSALFYLELIMTSRQKLPISIPSANKIIALIQKIPSLKKAHEKRIRGDTHDLWGIQAVPYQHLMQLKSYLLGCNFHKQGNFKQALKFYTTSLQYSHEQNSVQHWRQLALEQIEQIIRKKRIEQNKPNSIAVPPTFLIQQDSLLEDEVLINQNSARHGLNRIDQIDWNEKTGVYEMLSQYYVHRRSILFIIDSNFDSVWCEGKAKQYVEEQFGQLDSSDYFGFIKLSKNYKQDQLKLEQKNKNTQLKSYHLTKLGQMYRCKPEAIIDKKKRLQIVLDEALRQQSEILSTKVTVNGHTYLSPHKWIVCLIGQDVYQLDEMIERQRCSIQEQSNLNISIMGLGAPTGLLNVRASVQPWRREKEYKRLTDLTPRGSFAKVGQNKKTADQEAATFFSPMQVYKGSKFPVIKELFRNI